MIKRYFIELAYDGTAYCGWQIQPKVSTVQQTLEEALGILVPDLKGVMGCGRTDTGVHASQYFAHFDTAYSLHDNLVYKINAILPKDIAVYRVFEVESDVHARFSAVSRSYHYNIHFGKNPFRNHYSAFHPFKLDVKSMNEAAEYLLGEHDFSSFAKSQTQTKTNLCTVNEARWEEIEEGARFDITANRFLRNMVRAIVGTMFLVGEGKLKPSEMANVIEQQDRSAAGKSAYAHGLFLNKIEYPQF
jgi:tRNA pseudouridine38-40 synthase